MVRRGLRSTPPRFGDTMARWSKGCHDSISDHLGGRPRQGVAGGLPRRTSSSGTSTTSTSGSARPRSRACPTRATSSPSSALDAQWDSAPSPARPRDAGRGRRGAVPERAAVPGQPASRTSRAARPRSSRTRARRIVQPVARRLLRRGAGRRAVRRSCPSTTSTQAVRDVHWAKEHGLGGIMMPPLHPGGTLLLRPRARPGLGGVRRGLGLPISQHGGVGRPAYQPAGLRRDHDAWRSSTRSSPAARCGR